MKKAIDEIRGENTPELRAKLNDLRKEQFELRFRGAEGATKTTRHREVRRTIARIMMVLGDRARTEAAGASTEAAASAPAKAARPKAEKPAKIESAAKPARARKTAAAAGAKSADKKAADKKTGAKKQ